MTCRAWIFGLLLTAPLAAQAAPLPRYGAFVYSSLCYEGNTGDLLGTRFVLFRLPLHDMGYLEWSDGSLSSAPLQDLKIDDKSGRISFRYLRDFDDTTGKSNVIKSLSSTITAESVGLITAGGKPFSLTRAWSPNKDLSRCH